MTIEELRMEFAKQSVCGLPQVEITAKNPSTVQEYCLWLEQQELKRRNRYVVIKKSLKEKK